jgi:Dyp-type peroxidase family
MLATDLQSHVIDSTVLYSDVHQVNRLAVEAPVDSTVEPTTELFMEPVLAIHEIQGNSLGGFHKDYQMLLFLKISDVAAARQWLGEILPQIATVAEVLDFNRLFKATRQRRGKEGTVRSTFINIGFSYAGIQQLVPDADSFTDTAFKDGLAARSAALGDPTDPSHPGHPDNWVIGGPRCVPDMVLIVASDDRYRLDEEVQWLSDNLGTGLEMIYQQRGETLPGKLAGHEHFGFKDGISQPGIRGRVSEQADDFLTARENPDNVNQGKPGQDLLHAGEFIFGYPTQIGEPDPNQAGLNVTPGEIASAGPVWAENGSFLVFRRLRQDVKGFRSFIKQQAAELSVQNPGFADMSPEKLGAKFVGRWASGAPIVNAPDRDDLTLTDDVDFEFEKTEATKAGFTCPLAGHIRKAYPRDMTRGDFINESATQTHRLLRRGIPFGQPLASGCPMQAMTSLKAEFQTGGLKAMIGRLRKQMAKDNGDRGLLFLAYQTSIERQFEFVTQAWVNNPNFPDEGAGHDPILGQNKDPETREREVVLQAPAGQDASIKLPTDWVTPTGGGYFFSPSMSALSYLATGEG